MMKFQISFIQLLLAILAVSSLGAAEIPVGRQGFEETVKPFFASYCIDCHGAVESKRELRFDTIGDLAAGEDLEKWEQAFNKLSRHEMPPEEEPQPSAAERTAVVRWIDRTLTHYVEQGDAPAPPSVRRLTNLEYQNTLRDLLGFELKVIDDLPEDPEKFYRFNNTADLMRMGPEQLDRYLEIARRAMRAAIVDPQKPEVFKARREWTSAGADEGMGRNEVGAWGNRRNTAADGFNLKDFPTSGQFRIRMQASAILPTGYNEAPLNLDMGAPPGRTETPYETVATVFLTNGPDQPEVFEFIGRIENHPYILAKVGKGEDLVRQMSIRPRVFFDDGTLNDGGHYAKKRQLDLPRAVIDWIEFEAPIVDVWPPEHHTAILFESPLQESDPNGYIRLVLERFMSRAYRRPATEAEVDTYFKVYQLIRPEATLEEAVRETLAMVLVSPPFLLHHQADSATNEQFALASKLSYFLWASMPDEQLLELAAEGKLTDAAVVEEQVQRMLADEKSQAFVEDFVLQWLSIRKMLTVPINADLYPRFLYRVPIGETAGTEMPYLPTVRDYMMQESVGFVAELIRRNASSLQIVDSDFAVLNQRLAVHYGVPGVQGMRMRAVSIQPEHRLGGLLTHGSVLIGNGTGTAPHPIYRAVWLREAILGEDVPPPPSEVPALSDTAGESLEKALSITELLARHRTSESCNGCHARLDPWGVPFEEYNAIGRFQRRVPKDGSRVRAFNEKEDGDLSGYAKYLEIVNVVEVEAAAQVPGGPEINGVRELKDWLLKHRRRDIAENVIRRLLAYAIGRELTFCDRPAVKGLYAQAEANDFRLRDIIVSICISDAFRGVSSE